MTRRLYDEFFGPESKAPVPPKERNTSRKIIVLGVVGSVIVAGLLGGWYFVESQSHVGPTIVDDGPNFYQVLSALNASVEREPGGPWSIFSIMGLAAQDHFSPNIQGPFNLNLSVNACQAELNGLTLWNGTIPLFHGTFNSGTAPFWQLAYFSNATKQVLVATDVQGTSHVFGPIPFSSDCVYAWFDFWLSPVYWATHIYANGTLPVNSPVAAQVAWNHFNTTNIEQSWIDENNPMVEVLTSGPGPFVDQPGLGEGAWGIYFMGCGIAGKAAWQPNIQAYTDRNGSYLGQFNASRTCALQNYPPARAAYYATLFASPRVTAYGGTIAISIPYQLAIGEFNGSLTGDYDAWGLANWMVSMNLTTPSGQRLPMGSPNCSGWVPAISDCAANDSGWYAVLLSEGGGWLASYGATQNGPGWTVPVTAMVSHQQIVVVAPSSWNATGDVLSWNSTVSTSTVRGSVTL